MIVEKQPTVQKYCIDFADKECAVDYDSYLQSLRPINPCLNGIVL
jgi:hypothetical protein